MAATKPPPGMRKPPAPPAPPRSEQRCAFCDCRHIRHPQPRVGWSIFCTGEDGNGCSKRCARFQEPGSSSSPEDRAAEALDDLEGEVAPGEPACEHRHCRCERAVELVEQGRNAAAKAVGHQKVRCRQAGESS